MIKKLKLRGKSVARVTPKQSALRERKFRKSAEKINQKYAGLFRRLSE